MNLSKEDKAKIIDLHFNKMKSQNEIVSITGINKRWVNETCRAYASMQELNGMGATEATPQVTLFPKINPQSATFQPRNSQPEPQQNNWGFPSNNTYELEYKDRRIKDLEADKSDLRRKLETIETELATKTKELQLLQLEHRTIEKSHNLEVEFMRKMQELDKKPSTIDKILENETMVKMGLAGLMGKMGMGDAAAAVLGNAAPQTSSAEVQGVEPNPLYYTDGMNQLLTEMYQMLASANEQTIKELFEMLSLNMQFPGSVTNALRVIKAHLEKKLSTTNQTV